MNAERCLLAGEALGMYGVYLFSPSMTKSGYLSEFHDLGLGYAALRRAARYASERVVFGRPSGFCVVFEHCVSPTHVKIMNNQSSRTESGYSAPSRR